MFNDIHKLAYKNARFARQSHISKGIGRQGDRAQALLQGIPTFQHYALCRHMPLLVHFRLSAACCDYDG